MLAVTFEQSCVDSFREEITYGDWRDSYESKVTGVQDLGIFPNKYPDPSGSFTKYDVLGEAGLPAYVLSMVYDEGDSFGRATGKLSVLMVYTNKAMAYEAKRRFEDAFDRHGDTDQYTIEIPVESETGSREMFECRHPAGGYFETMKEIRLDHFIIT